MYAGGGQKYSTNEYRGLLINEQTSERVDLFLISKESVNISNKITSDTVPDTESLAEYIDMRPAEVDIEGRLVPSGYTDDATQDLDGQPTEKLNKLIEFCNNVEPGTSYKFISPALPYSYIGMYPTNLDYNNEGSSNAIDFSLTLEEVGMNQELPERGLPLAPGGPGTFHPRGSSRYHTTIAGPKEDGGGQIEKGSALQSNIEDILSVSSLDEKVEAKEVRRPSEGVSVPEIIGKLLGANQDLSERSTLASLQGRPEVGVRDLFGPPETEGALGKAIGQELGGTSFPAVSHISNSRLEESVTNIPLIGTIIDKLKGTPSGGEFLLEAVKKNQPTILFTMRSSAFQRVRNYIIEDGADTNRGTLRRFKKVTTLTAQENRQLKDAFQSGVKGLINAAERYNSLRSFVSELPNTSGEDTLTYYNYYGQPVMSFEGIIDVDFTRWATQRIELNGNEYELETFWNNSGFPVFSLKENDGTYLIKQERGFLGSDMLESVQEVGDLSGVHIVPFSVTTDIKTLQANEIGSSIYFMVVHTNKHAIQEVL